MGAEETKEKKKVLITYFENFMFKKSNNKLCKSIYKELVKKYGKDNDLVHFLGLRTKCLGSEIDENSLKKFNEVLHENQYDYIISIGKKICCKSRLERYCKEKCTACYVFDYNELKKGLFKLGKGKYKKGHGACYRLRDVLLDNYIKNNTKFEFIHIAEIPFIFAFKKGDNYVSQIATQISKQIEVLIKAK